MDRKQEVGWEGGTGWKWENGEKEEASAAREGGGSQRNETAETMLEGKSQVLVR